MVAADVEPEEIKAALFEVDDACLVLVEGQAPRCQPRGKPRLDFFRVLAAAAQCHKIVSIADQHG